jgi:hypothetical protein
LFTSLKNTNLHSIGVWLGIWNVAQETNASIERINSGNITDSVPDPQLAIAPTAVSTPAPCTIRFSFDATGDEKLWVRHGICTVAAGGLPQGWRSTPRATLQIPSLTPVAAFVCWQPFTSEYKKHHP